MLKPIIIGVGYNVLPKRYRDTWVRKKLESSGPTYIKMGQFVSSRGDIFDKHLTDTLSVLRDSVESLDWDDIKHAVDETKFSFVDKVPAATASIAQVHQATLHNGTHVAIKIKKPKVYESMKRDIEGLNILCTFFPMFKPTLTEFEYSLANEVNFKQEVTNLMKFGDMYRYDQNVVVPRVYPELCTDDLIVMDWVPSDGTQLLSRNLINMFVHQLLYEDHLHGDMHAGNIGVTDGKIILYDFGNVIRISKSYRIYMRDFVYHVQMKDIPAILETMKNMGMVIVNRKATISFMEKFLKYIDTVDIASFTFDPDEIQDMVPVQLDKTTFKILRSFSLLEGYCKKIDPGFSYNDILLENLELLYLDIDYISYRASKDLSRLTLIP